MLLFFGQPRAANVQVERYAENSEHRKCIDNSINEQRVPPLDTRRAARAMAASGVGMSLLGSTFLFHVIAETVSLTTAFCGRDAAGEQYLSVRYTRCSP